MSPSSQPTLWRTCRVLANRKRLQTLALLIRQPNQTVSAVAERMSLSVPAASQYLRALEARGLLTCRRVGRRVEYRTAVGTGEGVAGKIINSLRLVLSRRAARIRLPNYKPQLISQPERSPGISGNWKQEAW